MIHQTFKRKGFTMEHGFPIPDADANQFTKDLEQATRNGGGYKRLFIDDCIDKTARLKEGERAEISIITSGAVDREKEVLLAHGIDTRAYSKNPVVMYAHDYSMLPVGKAEWLKYIPDQKSAHTIKAKTVYAPKPQNLDHSQAWFPDTLLSMVQASYIKGKSIGLLALEIRRPTNFEIELRPELAKAKTVVSKSSMHEYSVCAIPMNAECLVTAVSKGVIKAPTWLLKQMGLPYEEEGETEYLDKCWEWDDHCEVVKPKTALGMAEILKIIRG